MGSYLHYSCADCEFATAIGGPEEFWLGPDGERLAYGHPEPVSEQAQRHGVDGFWMHLWCDTCRETRRVVTLELEEPCEPLDAWAGRGRAKPGYLAETERCPECKSELHDELPGPARGCPRCGGALACRR